MAVSNTERYMATCHSRRCAPLAAQFVSLLLWEGHGPTYVAEQARHSVATLASHCVGVLRELGYSRESVRPTPLERPALN